MKAHLRNPFFAIGSLFAVMVPHLAYAGGTIVTNNTGISAAAFSFIDNGWTGYTLVSQGTNGGDGDANSFGNSANWATAVDANYAFTGLTANATYNIYATWHYGGSGVGMTAKVGGNTIATIPQNTGNAPNISSGFTAYDDVNDTSAELRNFQLIGQATTDAGGNLTVNVTKASGSTYVRWDCFAVAPAPVLPPPGPRFWDGDSATANGASDNTATTAMNWFNGGNWDNGTTSIPQTGWNAGDTATFGGTLAGTQTVSVSGGIITSGLAFLTPGYTISGGSIAGSGTLTLTTHANATINSTVSATSITKEGAATLTLAKATGGAAALTANAGAVSINTGAFNSLGNPSGAITLEAGAVLSADNPANNAHNIGTVTLNGGTLTSANGPAGPANDGGYGNWLLNAAGTGVIVGGSSPSAISASTLDVGTRTFTVNDVTSSPTTDLTVSARIILGTLTKNGPGTMELTGTNTYGGNTIVNGGTLKLGASGTLGTSPTITVAAGATLDASATSGLTFTSRTLAGGGTVLGDVTIDNGTITATGPLGITSLTVSGFATLNVTPGPGSLTVTETDGINAGVAGNQVLVNVGTTPITSGTYPLVHFQGTIQGEAGAAAFELGTTPAGDYTYELVNSGSSLDLVVLPLAKLWTGEVGSDWTTTVLAPPKNWKAGTNPADFVNGDEVLFDDSATNTTVAISGGDVSPGTVLFSNLTKTYTLQGTGGIAGGVSLNKTGSGLLTILNTNSFSGAVTIEGGTLAAAAVADAGVPCALGAGTEVWLEGGTLALAGAGGSTNRLLSLGANSAIEVSSAAATVALTGEISGGPLTKTGPGTLALDHANTYSGVTRINAGTLSVSAMPNGGEPGPLGASSNAASNLIFAGGTLAYTGANTASDRGFTLTPSVSGTFNVTQPDTALSLSGPVTGAGQFVKSGPGTLVRSTTMNSYSSLTVDQGKLALATASFNGLSYTAPVTIHAGGVLSAENPTDNAHNLGLVTLNGGTLTSINGPVGPAGDGGFGNWVIAGIVAGGASPSTVSATSILLKTTGTSTMEVADVTGSPAADLIVSSSIMEDGLYSVGCQLIKAGDGTLELTGRNTYTGNTTVNAGTLVLADNAGLTFVIGNANGTSNKLTGSGTVVLDGDFAINTSAVTTLTTGTWLIEDNTTLAGPYGGTFTVTTPGGTPWTDSGNDIWTRTEGTKAWTFDETTGTLNLAVAAGFSSWIAGFGLDAADQDPTDDPDHDGVPNLVEYALAGRNPAVSDGPAGTIAGGLLGFTKRADASGITYRIEESDDLGLTDPWAEVSAYTENSATVISYGLLPATGAKKFARLAVTQQTLP